jgi:hypothetical protein
MGTGFGAMNFNMPTAGKIFAASMHAAEWKLGYHSDMALTLTGDIEPS